MLEEIVQVQAAILHDALQKAVRIAPTKGAAFDRSAGIKLTLVENGIEVRSTDEELFFYQKIEAIPSMADVSFRLPSQLFSGFIGSLPMNTDAHYVRFLWDKVDDPRFITVKFGNTKLKARLAMIVSGNFPEWQPHPFNDMSEAQELANRIEQVVWATNDSGLLAGTHMDGKVLVSINGKSLAAITPCVISVDAPVTAVLKPLVPLIKNGTDIRIKVIENRIMVALDPETQIRSTVNLMPWPNFIDKLMTMELPSCITVNRMRFIEMLNRMIMFVKNENVPRCQVTIAKDMIIANLLGDRGDITDATMVEEQTYHGDHDYKFNPYWLIDVLESFGCSKIKIFHNIEYPTRHPFHFVDPTGHYEAWVMGLTDKVS